LEDTALGEILITFSLQLNAV